MFPHTITIYHHDIINGADRYSKTVLSGFYVMQGKTVSDTQKGVDSKSQTTIISNAENAHFYGGKWTVSINDKVVLGVGKDIKSFRELKDCIAVSDIEINVCGSDVDNIVITGV